jgi:type IV pilus assembly protein PilX
MAPAVSNERGPAAQRGVALIVGLVILAVLSMIGVAAFSITTQQERMAGNSRDRIRAFEAAEAALRDCEAFVSGGAAPFDGTQGTYTAPTSSASQSITETSAAQAETWWQGTGARQMASSNGSALPAACVAERFTVQPTQLSPGSALSSVTAVNIAHITAHGYGLNKNTVVRLESYYAM